MLSLWSPEQSQRCATKPSFAVGGFQRVGLGWDSVMFGRGSSCEVLGFGGDAKMQYAVSRGFCYLGNLSVGFRGLR